MGKIPIERYARTKDNYCIVYLGPDINIINELTVARLKIEENLPGLTIHFCFRDDFSKTLDNAFGVSEFQDRKKNMGYIRQLTNNMISNPIEDLLEEL